MRYPRAFFVFNYQENLPDADHFKSLSNSSRAAYVEGISGPIKSIENQAHLVLAANCYLSNDFKKLKDVVVLYLPKVFDFFMAYFSDKNLCFFLIDEIASGEIKTGLESELRALLRQLLSINVLNHFEL